ncbi:hypothetical protein MAR_003739 [Mya arenaria]|uniref:Uncharacterized protein n=1 Tax=Mya arenaria TaxID=6604 RepID=A0ABY7GAR0_MYAAR|nr:hypothetical protein MAR_003739 [Mya arenaria]
MSLFQRWMTLLKEAMNKTQDAVYSVEATIYKNRDSTNEYLEDEIDILKSSVPEGKRSNVEGHFPDTVDESLDGDVYTKPDSPISTRRHPFRNYNEAIQVNI